MAKLTGIKRKKITYCADNFSKAALNIASRLPQAFDGCGRYLTGNILHENDHQLPARVDYQVSPKQTLFALTPDVNASRKSALVSQWGRSRSLSSLFLRLGAANRLRHWRMVSM